MTLKLWPECNYEEELAHGYKLLAASNQETFIALDGEKYAGFIQLSIRTDFVEGTTSSPVLYIEGIYIEPEYRNKGLASRLVKKAEEWDLAKNCTEIASDAELHNADSIEFHKAIGFKEVNRVVCFVKVI